MLQIEAHRLTDSPAVDDTKAGNEESDREKGMRDRVSRLVAKKRYSHCLAFPLMSSSSRIPSSSSSREPRSLFFPSSGATAGRLTYAGHRSDPSSYFSCSP